MFRYIKFLPFAFYLNIFKPFTHRFLKSGGNYKKKQYNHDGHCNVKRYD
jgi:hypothetical protein